MSGVLESFYGLCDEAVEGQEAPIKLLGRPDGLEYALDCAEVGSVFEEHVAGCDLWHAAEPARRNQLLALWATNRERATT